MQNSLFLRWRLPKRSIASICDYSSTCCSFSDCVFFCIVLRSFYVLFFYVSIMHLVTVLVLPTGWA